MQTIREVPPRRLRVQRHGVAARQRRPRLLGRVLRCEVARPLGDDTPMICVPVDGDRVACGERAAYGVPCHRIALGRRRRHLIALGRRRVAAWGTLATGGLQ